MPGNSEKVSFKAWGLGWMAILLATIAFVFLAGAASVILDKVSATGGKPDVEKVAFEQLTERAKASPRMRELIGKGWSIDKGNTSCVSDGPRVSVCDSYLLLRDKTGQSAAFYSKVHLVNDDDNWVVAENLGEANEH